MRTRFSSLLDIGKLIHMLIVICCSEGFSSLLDIGKLILTEQVFEE